LIIKFVDVKYASRLNVLKHGHVQLHLAGAKKYLQNIASQQILLDLCTNGPA